MATNEYGLTAVDEILSRERFSLEEVLDSEEVMQEAKFGHQGLIEFLSTPAVVEQLVKHTIAEPPGPAAAAEAAGDAAESDKRKTTAEEADASNTAAAASSSSSTASPADDGASASSAASAASSASTASSILATLSPDVLVSTVPAGSLLTEVIDENSSTITHTTDEHDLPVVREEAGVDEPAAAAASSTAATAAAADADENADSDPSWPEAGLSRPSDEDDALYDAAVAARAAATAAASAAASSADEHGTDLQPVYKNAHKFPYMSSELLCGEVGSVIDVLVEDERLLSLLFSLLQRPPPLDPSNVSYFRKVLQVLIQRKYPELVSFCARQNILDSLLRHLGLYSILELIIMLGWDSGLMDGSIDQTWMLSQRLIPKLVRRLAPRFQHMQDVHAHAGRLLVDVVVKCSLHCTSPLVEHLSTTPILQALCKHLLSGCVSSLSNSLSVIIVLVQRFANRRLEQMESHSQSANSSGDFSAGSGFDHSAPPPSTNEWNQPGDYEMAAAEDEMEDEEKQTAEDSPAAASSSAAAATPAFKPSPSTDPEVLALGEPFISLLPHLPKILDILLPEPTTAASASAAASSSSASASAAASAPSPPMPISGVLGAPAFGSLRMKVVELCLVLARSRSALIDAQLASLHVSRTMLQVFFAYPWNNLLHGLVESIVTSALEEPESQLTRTLFSEGQLVDAFIDGWKSNAACVAKGQMRRGYMGHLIRTAATVDHMLHAMSQTQRDSLLQDSASRWHWFVSEILSEELSAQQSEDSLEVLLGGGGVGGGGGMTQSMTQQDLQHAQQQQQMQQQQQHHSMVPDGYAVSYDDHDAEEEEDGDHDHDQHDQEHEHDSAEHHHSNAFHTHSHSHALTSRDDLDEEDGGGGLGGGLSLSGSDDHNESEEWVGAASYFHPHPHSRSDQDTITLGGGGGGGAKHALDPRAVDAGYTNSSGSDSEDDDDAQQQDAQHYGGQAEQDYGTAQGQEQQNSRPSAHAHPSQSVEEFELRLQTAREARARQAAANAAAAAAASLASVPAADAPSDSAAIADESVPNLAAQ